MDYTTSLPEARHKSTCLDKIDRMDWKGGITVTIDRLRIGIRTNDVAIIDQLLGLLPPGWKVSKGRLADRLFSVRVGQGTYNPLHQCFSGWVRKSRSNNLQDVLDSFEREVKMYVAEFSRTRTYIHAGVVEWQGKAIVIPGTSYSGKTTLVQALLEAGATYVSDEYAAVDRQGRVHPYAIPLGVRIGEGFPRQTPVTAESLGATVARRALPVGAVVLTRYEAGAASRFGLVSGGFATLETLTHCVAAQVAPQRAMETLATMMQGVVKLKGTRGEAAAAATELLNVLTEEWEGHDQRKIA